MTEEIADMDAGHNRTHLEEIIVCSYVLNFSWIDIYCGPCEAKHCPKPPQTPDIYHIFQFWGHLYPSTSLIIASFGMKEWIQVVPYHAKFECDQ